MILCKKNNHSLSRMFFQGMALNLMFAKVFCLFFRFLFNKHEDVSQGVGLLPKNFDNKLTATIGIYRKVVKTILMHMYRK